MDQIKKFIASYVPLPEKDWEEISRCFEFNNDIRFTGFMKYLFGWMLGGQFRKVLPGVMHQFIVLTEAS